MNFVSYIIPVLLLCLCFHSTHINGRKPRKNCDCVCGAHGKPKGRIVGGNEAAPNEFPWIATMTHNGTFYCGATLITRRHLLTAAHCVLWKKPSDILVGLGEHNRTIRAETGARTHLKLKKTTVHEGFNLRVIQHDIAILELEEPVDLNPPYITTGCLPQHEEGSRNYSGLDGVVAGWGRHKENGVSSSVLHKVTLPLLTRDECTHFGYKPKKILQTNFCAGYPEGKRDACQGDSGGPIHLKPQSKTFTEIIGIVSWGRGCGRPNYPGVYTRIDKYLSWIERHLDGECLCEPPK